MLPVSAERPQLLACGDVRENTLSLADCSLSLGSLLQTNPFPSVRLTVRKGTSPALNTSAQSDSGSHEKVIIQDWVDEGVYRENHDREEGVVRGGVYFVSVVQNAD